MIATGFRPRGIDGTAAGSAIKKDAVATGHSGEGKSLAFIRRFITITKSNYAIFCEVFACRMMGLIFCLDSATNLKVPEYE
ncbi:hypothetical protein [Desulfocastanea catecholica]